MEDEIQHRVKISQGFWMGKYPVTQGLLQAVMGNRPSHFGGLGLWRTLLGAQEEDELWKSLPVEQVNWNHIAGSGGFIEKANQTCAAEDGRFHLPTEARWEYACRAGTKGAYAGDLDKMAWYAKNSGGRTHPVGQKEANAWGQHDMQGNVWEWCADWYGEYPRRAVTDPRGAISGAYRVFRGGSWSSSAIYCCRVANRHSYDPTLTDYDIGFRIARSSVP